MTPTTSLRPSRAPMSDAQKAANHEAGHAHHWGMWHPTDEAGNRHERRCIFCGRVEVEHREGRNGA
jgi:hypothetical protein